MNLLTWLAPWELSPTFLIVFVATIVFYARGASLVPARRLHEWLFALGMAGTYLVSQTHLEYFSEHEFFVHRFQHLVLHHLAPFLLILAHPGRRLWAGLPAQVRQTLSGLASSWWGQQVALIWHSRWLATLLFVGVVWLWLIPGIHLVAMLDWRWYRVMNTSVFVTGLMFWNLTLPPTSENPARVALGGRMLMLIGVILPQVALGAVLFFEPRSIYPVYSLCGRAFTHLSELADQQIGALILWIPGSMMSVLAAVMVMRDELSLSRRKTVLRRS